MNPVSIFAIKLLRKIHTIIVQDRKTYSGRNYKMFSDKNYANKMIYDLLVSKNPCMIARLGATELKLLRNFLGVNTKKKDAIKYIQGVGNPWWWEKQTLKQIRDWSGFFPATPSNVVKFCDQMLRDMRLTDVLGSWLIGEDLFSEYLKKSKRVVLEDLEPFFCSHPWTSALKGKKVLVVHPFSDLIESQYKKRDKLFDDNTLPEFELITIKAVQSLGGDNSKFSNWFDALEDMKAQIDYTTFDICIIGCGAYGFPLAAHVKRIGKKAVHLGGVTQTLFGINGKRWESFKWWPYMNLVNEYWVKPGSDTRPKNAEEVEGACYW